MVLEEQFAANSVNRPTVERLGGRMVAVAEKKGVSRKALVVWGVLILCVLGGIGALAYKRLRWRDVQLYRTGMLHLRSGNTAAAVENLRRALEITPDMDAAREGLIRALTERKEFEQAQAEIDEARQKGMAEPAAALLRARIMALRATHRIRSAGAAVDVELCDAVIEEDLEPAVELTREFADKAAEPALAFTSLGDLLMQQSQLVALKWRLFLRQAENDRTVGRTEEAAQQVARGRALQPELARLQGEAVQAYRRAIDLDETLLQPRIKVAQHYLSTFVPRPNEAHAVLEPALQAEPGNREVRQLMAAAERLAGNYEAALEHLDAASSDDGQPEEAILVARGQVLADVERWPECEQTARRALAESPDSRAAAYLLGTSLLAQHGDTGGEPIEEAVTHLQHALRGNAAWPQARLELARCLFLVGRPEQARSALRAALDGVGASQPASLRQAREMSQVQYQAALRMWQELSDESPERAAEYARDAFRAMPFRHDGYEAYKQARVAAGDGPEDLENLALLHATAVIARGELERALSIAETEADALREEGRPDRLLILSARLQTRLGNFAEAVEAYREVLEMEPDSRAAYELGLLQTRLGHLDEAQEVLSRLVGQRPEDSGAILGLVGVLMRKGDTQGARAVLSSAEERLGKAATTALLINLSVFNNQIEDAIQLAQQLAADEPDRPQTHAVLAELLWRDGQTEEARAAYNRAIELAPQYAPVYSRGLLDLATGRVQEAEDLFETAVEQLPERLMLRVHLAVARQANGKMDEAIEDLSALLQNERTRTIGEDLVGWMLGVAQAGSGRIEAAVEQNQAVGRSEFGYRQDRESLLRALAELSPPERREAAEAMNRLVVFSRAGYVAPARRELDDLRALLPEQPMPALMYARVLDKQGEHEQAVEHYRSLLDRHPDYAFAWVQLAESYASHQEFSDAIQTLEDALDRVPAELTGRIHVRLGSLYQEQAMLEQAESHFRAALEDEASAPIACNNLAYMLAVERGDTVNALPLAQKAVEAAPGAAAFLDTLGWIHYLRDETDQALPLLEQARRAMPTNPTVRYHLGMAYLKAGRAEDARAELTEALNLSQSFPEAADARRALENIEG